MTPIETMPVSQAATAARDEMRFSILMLFTLQFVRLHHRTGSLLRISAVILGQQNIPLFVAYFLLRKLRIVADSEDNFAYFN